MRRGSCAVNRIDMQIVEFTGGTLRFLDHLPEQAGR